MAQAQALTSYQVVDGMSLKAALSRAERRNKTREFVEAEAQVHFDVYLQVTQVIASLCEQRGYRMAVRFTSTPMTADDPQSIMQTVNEYVIFHQPRVDITQDVIQAIGGQSQMSNRPLESDNR